MLKKTYKNKGIPVKGSEIRTNRTVRLSDSAWDGLAEAAQALNVTRAQLIEWWSAVLTNNEAKMAEIAKNENCTIEELSNRIWQQIPGQVQQLQANKQPPGFPLQIKPQDESQT